MLLFALALVLVISASVCIAAELAWQSLDTGFSVGTSVLAILALQQQFTAFPTDWGRLGQAEEK
jgi:hypothetical protein